MWAQSWVALPLFGDPLYLQAIQVIVKVKSKSYQGHWLLFDVLF